jgi:hemerythrin-like domain-containing protein
MKITEAFLGEHAILYAQFDHLDEAVIEAISLAEIKAQGAMLEVALNSHAQLEEDLLFKTLDEHGEMEEALREARHDHERIENLMADILDQLTDIRRMGHARRLLLKVLETARTHFANEETNLFPQAESVLGEEVLSELGDEWAEQRGLSTE